jgi:prolipoprotein diacylglyceryltransferase
MGIFLGRIGCFFTGCCYGDYADPAKVSWGLPFPGNSPPQLNLVQRGLQTAYGFVLEEPQGPVEKPIGLPTIRAVDGHAAAAGLRPGDQVLRVWNPHTQKWIKADDAAYLLVDDNGREREVEVLFLWYVLRRLSLWQVGDPLELAVARPGQGEVELELMPLQSLPVHPTQLYSAFDGLVLFLLVTAYYPFRQRLGEVLALLMIGYAINRFLIEQLRNDTELIWFNLMTLSQGISIILFLGGIVFLAWLRLCRPPVAVATPSG